MTSIVRLVSFASALMFIVAATPMKTEAASFNCNKAKSYTTITICSDNALSKIDGRLGRAYKKARTYYKNRGNHSEARRVKRDQKAWLKSRNLNCNSSERKASSNYWPDAWQVTCFFNETSDRLTDLMWEVPQRRWPNAYYNWCRNYGLSC